MRSITCESGTVVLHNGHFRGQCLVYSKKDFGNEQAEPFYMDFEDFKTVVAEYIRQHKMEKIERASVNQLLGL